MTGIKNLDMFTVCDGHGLNGHFVSEYVKEHLAKYIASAGLKF